MQNRVASLFFSYCCLLTFLFYLMQSEVNLTEPISDTSITCNGNIWKFWNDIKKTESELYKQFSFQRNFCCLFFTSPEGQKQEIYYFLVLGSWFFQPSRHKAS